VGAKDLTLTPSWGRFKKPAPGRPTPWQGRLTKEEKGCKYREIPPSPPLSKGGKFVSRPPFDKGAE